MTERISKMIVVVLLYLPKIFVLKYKAVSEWALKNIYYKVQQNQVCFMMGDTNKYMNVSCTGWELIVKRVILN